MGTTKAQTSLRAQSGHTFVVRSLVSILSVNEKIPVSKFRYFGEYIIQLFGYCYVHVSGQRQTGLDR